uniref:Uncharacterized protein n=1 Tax=Melopsittacus undulatus TaxID=13146 RepID=A0A8C6JHP8_MELUD
MYRGWGRVPGPGTGAEAGVRRFRDLPSFSCAAVPAEGARHEAQVRAAARGERPRLRVPLTPDRPHREALGRGAASLRQGEGPGTLRLQGDAPCSGLELCPLPAGEARSQLRALVFGMAGRIESLERRLSGTCGPVRIGVRARGGWAADPKPWKNRGAGSALPARRKIPGESLINPGFKR